MQGTGVSSKEDHTPKARFSKARAHAKKLTQRAGRRGGGSSLGVGTSTALQTGLNAFGVETESYSGISQRRVSCAAMCRTACPFHRVLMSFQAKQGLLFSSTRAAPELAVLDETVELSAFYKEAMVPPLQAVLDSPDCSEGRQVATAEVPKEVAVLVRGEAERAEQMLG